MKIENILLVVVQVDKYLLESFWLVAERVRVLHYEENVLVETASVASVLLDAEDHTELDEMNSLVPFGEVPQKPLPHEEWNESVQGATGRAF